MIITANAKRYAKALFELALEKARIDEIHQDFKDFLNLIEHNPDLKSVLNLPADRDREKLVTELIKERLSELFFNFLLSLIHSFDFSFDFVD